MKKLLLFGAFSVCLLLTACSNTPVGNTSNGVEQTSQNKQNENTDNNSTVSSDEKKTSEEITPTTTDLDYETILREAVGEDYLIGKALMRYDDQEILGNVCAVYKLGINKEEVFTALEWFGISKEGKVYIYDIVMDEWSEFEVGDVTDYGKIDSCIYMLNEYVRDEFFLEYYDIPEEIKRAVFEDENSTDGMPSKLIGMNEETPQGYFFDPLERAYYPVTNFKNTDELEEYFSEYFTGDIMEEIEVNFSYNLLDFEGALYLERGGRGYGTVSLDFDTVDYSNFESDKTVIVDKLLFGEKDGKFKITFEMVGDTLKISKVQEL